MNAVETPRAHAPTHWARVHDRRWGRVMASRTTAPMRKRQALVAEAPRTGKTGSTSAALHCTRTTPARRKPAPLSVRASTRRDAVVQRVTRPERSASRVKTSPGIDRVCKNSFATTQRRRHSRSTRGPASTTRHPTSTSPRHPPRATYSVVRRRRAATPRGRAGAARLPSMTRRTCRDRPTPRSATRAHSSCARRH